MQMFWKTFKDFFYSDTPKPLNHFHTADDWPFPQAQGMMGNVGDGQGEGGSSLMKERSGYLLTSMSATLSGDDDGMKLSGLSRSTESWTLKKKTHKEERRVSATKKEEEEVTETI